MRKFLQVIVILTIAAIFAACGGGDKEKSDDADKLTVVSSFTIIEDIVKEIGGDLVAVHNLVPIGTDPHEYDPLPDDIKAVTDADILFFNGLNLEGGEQGWFAKMMASSNQDWDLAYEVTSGVTPMYLSSDDGKTEEINPHAFLNPKVGIVMAENVRDGLIAIDSENEAEYEEKAATYIASLEEMDAQYEEKINEIPEADRVLITSERAYQYMADRYGLEEGYIWAIDTEENGTPEQIKDLIAFVKEKNPSYLFVETNVDQRPMETVASETGVEIFGEIFSDEIGKAGEEGDTYLKFLQHNIDLISEGLKAD